MKYKSVIYCLIIGELLVIGATADEDHSNDIKGKECKLTEPVYGTQFDLNGLHSEMNTKKVKSVVNNADFVEFNVCGNSNLDCDGEKSTACLTKDGKQIRFGSDLDKEPIYTNGRVYFNFTGNVCNKNTNELYTLLIITTCDYSSHTQNPIIFMPYSEDQCTFVLMWKTRSVCHPLSGPLSSNRCVAKDPQNNHEFNLMPLSDYNHKLTFKGKMEFLINICKPTLYSHNEMCPPNSSICLDDPTQSDLKKRFKNYGTTVPDPTFENGKLFMKFTSDEKCSDKDKNITSVINFICDETIQYGEPEYVGEENCEYRFNWETAFACNKATPCRTIDPTTGFVYDLNELSGKTYTVEQDDKKYVFGICKNANAPCLDKVGACLVTGGQSSSMGTVSSILEMSEEKSDAPFLSYKSGSVCGTLDNHWTTKIEFVCQTDGMPAGPKIVENSNCSLIIHFATKLVCNNEIQCKVQDNDSGREIDLTPLKSTTHNYLARINDTMKSKQPTGALYYLNVCRPLLPQYGLSCNANSAACRAILNGTKNPEHEQSLGYPRVSLTLVNTDYGYRPQLKYLDGSSCQEDPSSKLSSQIDFYCDPMAGKGTPILQEIVNECHYKFDWPTNVMCPLHIGDFRDSTCEIYNSQINQTTDLKSIFKDGLINIDYAGNSMEVNLCKNSKKIEIDYSQNSVKIFFDQSAKCGQDATINVEMRLVCNEIQSHTLTSDTQSCGYVYTLQTPLICPQLAIEVANSTDTDAIPADANKSIPTKYTATFWVAMLGLTATVVFLLVLILALLRNPDRCYRIMHLFRRGNASVHYSRVFSNEEADLLLDQPGGLSDSDEDLLI